MGLKNTTLKKDSLEIAVEKYTDILFRTSYILLKNYHDAEDVVQDTFLQYIRKRPSFENENKEKSWLITVAVNRCKNINRFKLSHPKTDISELNNFVADNKSRSIVEELSLLPTKYKVVMILHYIEGYPVKDVADILKISESAVKKRLEFGRKKLKIICEAEDYDS